MKTDGTSVNVYVAGSSALFYWRRNLLSCKPLKKHVLAPLSDCPIDARQLRDLDIDNGRFGPAPIHLFVPTHELRVSKRLYTYSIRGKNLPETAFRHVEKGICLASPEYCLIQAACVFSRFKLLELCMEICGKYALIKESERGFTPRDYPLASVQSIAKFLQTMKSEPGVLAVQRILPFAADGSRSPMETRTYLLMCLPKRLGGYGLPKPEINKRIDLKPEERSIAKRSYFECDFCWPDQKVVIEYDGQQDHSSRLDRDRDSTKRNILLSKGYTIYTITAGQIASAESLDRIVREIAKLIGHRFFRFPKAWVEQRDELRRELFLSMS